MRAVVIAAVSAGFWTGSALAQGHSIGPGAAPQHLNETTPPEAVPERHTTGEANLNQDQKRYTEDALARVQEWQSRADDVRLRAEQSGDAEQKSAANDLDRAVLTAKNSWDKLRQVPEAGKFEAERTHMEAAFDQLEKIWDRQVTEK